jgi:hypothetical protein
VRKEIILRATNIILAARWAKGPLSIVLTLLIHFIFVSGWTDFKELVETNA